MGLFSRLSSLTKTAPKNAGICGICGAEIDGKETPVPCICQNCAGQLEIGGYLNYDAHLAITRPGRARLSVEDCSRVAAHHNELIAKLGAADGTGVSEEEARAAAFGNLKETIPQETYEDLLTRARNHRIRSSRFVTESDSFIMLNSAYCGILIDKKDITAVVYKDALVIHEDLNMPSASDVDAVAVLYFTDDPYVPTFCDILACPRKAGLFKKKKNRPQLEEVYSALPNLKYPVMEDTAFVEVLNREGTFRGGLPLEDVRAFLKEEFISNGVYGISESGFRKYFPTQNFNTLLGRLGYIDMYAYKTVPGNWEKLTDFYRDVTGEWFL